MGFDCCQAVPHGLEAALVYCGLFLRPFFGLDCYDDVGLAVVGAVAAVAVAVVGVVVVVGGVPCHEADGEPVDRLDAGHLTAVVDVGDVDNVEIVAVFSTPPIQNCKIN